jgi:hypothetical protein
MTTNITCNPGNRTDILNLFNNTNDNYIDLFICGTDMDNSFGGSLSYSDTLFMYARSSGFVEFNKTQRGATIIKLTEESTTDCG